MSKSIKITMRICREQMDVIDAAARKEFMTRSKFLREVIEATLPLFHTGTLVREFRGEMDRAVEGKRPANMD